jgi:hypothetical protein
MMLAIFGGCAAAVAQRLILTRANRIQILQWLAPLEAVARRLLLIEALKLPAPNAPAPFIRSAKLASAYADRPHPDLPESAEAWRVRFHIGIGPASRPRLPAQNVASGAASPVQFNAIALARRMEALRRLFGQREAYARRLALRVHHAGARARKAFAPYRHRATAVRTLMRTVQREADLALAALNSS